VSIGERWRVRMMKIKKKIEIRNGWRVGGLNGGRRNGVGENVFMKNNISRDKCLRFVKVI
jgi:hypothetical protein